MATTNENGAIGIYELTLYDKLIKQYIDFEYQYANNNQIDELFESGGDEPVNPPSPSIEIKPFATATDEELISIINGYYNGNITLEQIQEIWSVGNERNITISAITTSGDGWTVSESHREQAVVVRIIDFDHDTLTESIYDKDKALLTLELKDCLMSEGAGSGVQNTEIGSMNNWTSSSWTPGSNTTGWTNCARRAWCNNGFYNALPNYIKNLIKPVDKLTKDGGYLTTITTTSDKVFLLSAVEVTDYNIFSIEGEGLRYAYYNASEPSILAKMPLTYTSYISSKWWLRSPTYQSTESFCIITTSGTIGSEFANGDQIIDWSPAFAPAFCL